MGDIALGFLDTPSFPSQGHTALKIRSASMHEDPTKLTSPPPKSYYSSGVYSCKVTEMGTVKSTRKGVSRTLAWLNQV